MPKSPIEPNSLKDEAGIAKLNTFLAERSYIADDVGPTAEDMACFAAIACVVDKSKFPNAARWYRHIRTLRATHAPHYAWPAAGASGAAAAKAKAKAKKEPLQVDVKAVAWKGDKMKSSPNPPALGVGSKPLSRKGGGHKGKYYITTAINYANGAPHMGHAYEALTADVFARHHRFMGEDVYFMTGSDEHGQKIAEKAAEEGLTPIASCDRYVEGFKALNQRLLVSNDYYIRTTDAAHESWAQEMWKKLKSKGDIYLANYEGWYCVREEKYFTDTEAQESDYKDPVSGKPLEKRAEPSFFFKLSKFADRVTKHIEANEEFVQPQQFRGEILERLRSIEMRDLSISRGTFTWGVPCPEDKVDGSQHVMYVWFEALMNYASGVSAGDKKNPLSRFWPADMHIVGKDISWFHSVIWPAMLMSVELPLPRSIVVHGFVAGSDGRKMSKSLNNAVDAHEELDVLSADSFRWYLCRESPYGDDIKFSVDVMRLMHNADLVGNLGNLVNRAVNLCGGAVPELGKADIGLPFDLAELKAATKKVFLEYRLSEAADLAVRAGNSTNKWITDLAPWNMKGEDQQALRASCCRLLLEAVYVLAHFFSPFIPTAGDAIFKKIGVPPTAIPDLSETFVNLTTGAPVASGTVLFEPLEVQAPVAAKTDAAPKAEPKAKASSANEKGKGKEAAATADDDQPLFSKLDVRVGRVVEAWHHPDADRLFVEKIDVGDPEGPRQIVSGLREVYTLEEFQGRKLLAVCNMKPSKLVKVDSYGMVLCAKEGKDKIELLDVPDNLEVGTRILPKGVANKFTPFKPEAVKKKKVWEGVAELLRTDKDRVATFDGAPLQGPGGEKFLAPTLPNAQIS